MQVIFISRPPPYDFDRHKIIFYLCVYFCAVLTIFLAVTSFALANGGQTASQTVPLNQIIEIKLPENSATVLLGNPEIADILSQGPSSVVIGGKRVGETNLLVKDRDQNMILNIELTVGAANRRNITIFIGSSRSDFVCEQSCYVLKSDHPQDNQSTLLLKQDGVK